MSNIVDYRIEPSQYKHWSFTVDGDVATFKMDVNEDAGIREGYKLKLNSYDLGVDIELHDAVQRVRFEHPSVKTIVLTSGKDRIFCSGANIFMLGLSSHGWKVNFCKFTNETRNGLEDSSKYSGLKVLAAINGACAGGGYEVALAADELLLIDDRSSAVSLPEVPLLGVLPGTGGLTRLTDKRKVRHDLADIFCTTTEGVRGQKAVDWRLVDHLAKPAVFAQEVAAKAAALAANSIRPGVSGGATGIKLPKIERTLAGDTLDYANVSVTIDRSKRAATLIVKAPSTAQPSDVAGIHAAGAAWWPLAMCRELDDAILHLRTNELDIGTWVLKTSGDAAAVLACDEALIKHANDWLVRETTGYLRRTLARLDVSSRTLVALIEQGSCFVGTLAELAFCADRTYMLHLPDNEAAEPKLQLNALNFGSYPMTNDQGRLARRFYEETNPLAAAQATIGSAITAKQAAALGLVTDSLDDIDYDDEVRQVLESRAALSPDSLTGLEANLRFAGKENMNTRIFGRLSAWQNWIFYRPNASAEKGALKLYGKGERAHFDLNRV